MWPHKFYTHNTGYILPSISTSWDSITSYIASPISDNLTSIPAVLTPVIVASLTAYSKGLNFSSKATVNAESIR